MKKTFYIILIKIALCGALIGLLFHKMDMSQFPLILKSLDFRYFLLAFVLIFVNTSLSAFKWKLLLKADGVDISFLFLLQSYLVGTFMNIFLPSSIGGDVVRIYDVAKKSKSASKSVASVFIDRASGFFALSTIGMVASFLGTSMIHDKGLHLTLLAVFSFIFISFIALFNQKIHKAGYFILSYINIKKVSDLFKKLTDSLTVYSSRKTLLLKILSISFCFQGLVIVIVYIYSIALGFDARFLWFMIFIPVITVIESIPLTPFALGTRDWGYVFFFTSVGMQMEKAALLAITYVVMTVIYSLTGAVIFVLRKKTE